MLLYRYFSFSKWRGKCSRPVKNEVQFVKFLFCSHKRFVAPVWGDYFRLRSSQPRRYIVLQYPLLTPIISGTKPIVYKAIMSIFDHKDRWRYIMKSELLYFLFCSVCALPSSKLCAVFNFLWSSTPRKETWNTINNEKSLYGWLFYRSDCIVE